MKLVLLSLACLSAVHSSPELAKKIHRDINKWNADVACWGRENALKFHVGLMQAAEHCSSAPHHNLLKPANPFLALLTPTNNPFQTLPSPSNNPFQTLPAPSNNPFQTIPAPANNPFQTLPAPSNNPFQTLPSPARSPFQTLAQPVKQGFNAQNWNKLWSSVFVQPSSRSKRAATDGLLETDEEDFQEFLEDFADYKEDWATKMSNLTCVLSQMNMLDSSLQVNIKAYNQDFWNQIDLSKTLAGSDPVWRNMMITGYNDCYSIAKAWPQETLDKNPITKVFGRHMIFFKCAKKVEKKCCMEAQANDWLTTIYGQDLSFNYAQHGLPSNKYERAAVAVKVLHEAASDEEEFVGDFFYGDHHM